MTEDETKAANQLAQKMFDETPPFYHCDGRKIDIALEDARKECQTHFFGLACRRLHLA